MAMMRTMGIVITDNASVIFCKESEFDVGEVVACNIAGLIHPKLIVDAPISECKGNVTPASELFLASYAAIVSRIPLAGLDFAQCCDPL